MDAFPSVGRPRRILQAHTDQALSTRESRGGSGFPSGWHASCYGVVVRRRRRLRIAVRVVPEDVLCHPSPESLVRCFDMCREKGRLPPWHWENHLRACARRAIAVPYAPDAKASSSPFCSARNSMTRCRWRGSGSRRRILRLRKPSSIRRWDCAAIVNTVTPVRCEVRRAVYGIVRSTVSREDVADLLERDMTIPSERSN